MSWLNSRQNILDGDHGKLSQIDNTGQQLYYLREDDKPAYINAFMFGTSSTTVIGTQSEFQKLEAVTTQGFSRNGLVHTSNRITNSGVSKVFKGEAILSISSGNNNEIHLAFYKNGSTKIPCSEQEVTTDSGGRLNAIPIQCLVELNTNDYVEIWVMNDSGTTDVVCDNYNFIVKEM